jgi:hypothetical protein
MRMRIALPQRPSDALRVLSVRPIQARRALDRDRSDCLSARKRNLFWLWLSGQAIDKGVAREASKLVCQMASSISKVHSSQQGCLRACLILYATWHPGREQSACCAQQRNEPSLQRAMILAHQHQGGGAASLRPLPAARARSPCVLSPAGFTSHAPPPLHPTSSDGHVHVGSVAKDNQSRAV